MLESLDNRNLAFFLATGMSIQDWEDGGMLEREINVFNELAKQFNKAYIFTYGDTEDLDYQDRLADNAEIVCNNTKYSDITYSLFLPFIHRDKIKNCDIFRTDQIHGSWSAWLSSIGNGKFILRAGYVKSLFRKKQLGKYSLSYLKNSLAEFILYHACDKGFVTSKEGRDYVTNKYRLPKSRVFVTPNYINTEVFKPEEKEKKEDRILFVGRIAEQKNLLNLVEALEGTGHGLGLVGDGNMKDDVKKKAEKHNVDVRFLGVVPNFALPDYHNKYSIFVLPSFYEGMPKTLLEAMSSGMACVATDVDGSREIIKHGETGLLAEDCSPDALREQIKRLHGNQALQEQLGSNARKFVEDNFSLKTMIDKELKVYKTLLG